jgi:hypothetical protein
LVVVGEDGADQAGGVSTGAAGREVGAVGLVAAVFALTDGALVEVGGIGVAAAGHRDVEQARAVFSPSTAWVVSAVTPWAECTVTA